MLRVHQDYELDPHYRPMSLREAEQYVIDHGEDIIAAANGPATSLKALATDVIINGKIYVDSLPEVDTLSDDPMPRSTINHHLYFSQAVAKYAARIRALPPVPKP